MQSGELFVTGKDEIIIDLKGYSADIEVAFHGHPHVVPCNHRHHDSLTWEVKRILHHHKDHSRRHPRDGGFALVIKWDVTNVRNIKWKVRY